MLKRLRLWELARQRRGWSMRELSERLLVAHQTVLYWNQGRVFPRLSQAVELSRLLGCSLEDLIEDDPRRETFWTPGLPPDDDDEESPPPPLAPSDA